MEEAAGAKTGKTARFQDSDGVEEGDEAGHEAAGRDSPGRAAGGAARPGDSGLYGSAGWESGAAMEQSGGGNFEERKLHLPVWMLVKRQGGEDGYVNLESLDCDEVNTPFNVDTKRALKDSVNQYGPASCITQLKAEGPSRTCNESKEEEEEYGLARACRPWPCRAPQSWPCMAPGLVWARKYGPAIALSGGVVRRSAVRGACSRCAGGSFLL